MTQQWRWRLLSLAVASLAVETGLVLAGMRPRVVLVAAVLVAVAATMWLVTDLGGAVEPAAWRPRTRRTLVAGGADLRTQLMRTRLTSKWVDAHAVESLHSSLVGLLDERLLTEHMIDRHVEPHAAHALIGPELTRFVSEPALSTPLSDPRGLARIVTLIECI